MNMNILRYHKKHLIEGGLYKQIIVMDSLPSSFPLVPQTVERKDLFIVSKYVYITGKLHHLRLLFVVGV